MLLELEIHAICFLSREQIAMHGVDHGENNDNDRTIYLYNHRGQHGCQMFGMVTEDLYT